jgi:hypothetical protein
VVLSKDKSDMEKTPLKGLFRNEPSTREGKYLVLRRDGTVFEHPSFVLGGRDPIADVALRAYAEEVYRIMEHDPAQAKLLGLTPEMAAGVLDLADIFSEYRKQHGTSDPGMGPHRKDDPAIIARMREGRSA